MSRPFAPGAAWAGLCRAARRHAAAIARIPAEARERRMRALLDAQALRDLGVDRSELPSFTAQCDGLADHTRRRLASVT